MSLIKGIQDPSVESTQNWLMVEFTFQGAAPGSNGVRLTPVAHEGAAGAKVCVQLGGTSGVTSLALTQAQAEALCMPEGAATAEITTLATALRTLANAPSVYATTNGNRAVTFVVGGLRASRIKKAELEFVTGGTSAGATVCKLVETAAATVTGPLDTVKSSYTLGTDKLIVARGVVAGSFAVPDITQVPAATGVFVLRVWIRN